MTFKECRQDIKSDLGRLTIANKKNALRYLLFNASFKITFWFRLDTYLGAKKNIIFKTLYGLTYVIHKRNQLKTGIQIDFMTTCGKGLNFPHFSCIVINGGALIGANCTIFQGVTIGSVRGKGTPIIGDNVVLAPGCKIVGNIKIGDNVFIAPNTVVIKDVPEGATVAGVPAKVINLDGAKNVLMYL
ncbi:serine O-acetyltransferase [Polaribacter sp. Q13]|uniref:serine O-acetyltransferase n=1 Tax=Polaribacter sp. Q13 TaxID=2806551 RepID=UPI002078847D|nr:serine acetyltransferase [Polaribacter sp. Q13]